jgi:predicted nucleotidyltransferase
MNTLAELLSSRVKAEVFRLLFGPGAEGLHVREIGRRARLADATVRQELRKLARLGLVEVRRDGNRACYAANPKHPLYPEIRNLVLKTSGLADVLREALMHPGIRVALVFGSVAAGKERPESDVDLLVIGSVGLRQLAKLLSRPGEVLSREINPHVMSADEFLRRQRAHDHFISSVLSGPRLFLIGDERELEAMGR